MTLLLATIACIFYLIIGALVIQEISASQRTMGYGGIFDAKLLTLLIAWPLWSTGLMWVGAIFVALFATLIAIAG